MILIDGIPCHLRTVAGKAAVREVLRRVRSRCEPDFHRLTTLVRGIHPLGGDDAGTLGEWKKLNLEPDPADPSTYGYGIDFNPGHVFVREDLGAALAGVLAHEFGHACTTHADLRRRRCWDGEWASEAAAEWYAYKWGFGREIAHQRASRARAHHGPAPGQRITTAAGVYVLSRRFVFRRVGAVTVCQ